MKMKEQIRQAVRIALGGSRKVRVTFKREATVEALYLVGMAQGGIVQLDEEVKIVLMCVHDSGYWDSDTNRMPTVTLTDRFDENWFVSRLEHALETIEVLS